MLIDSRQSYEKPTLAHAFNLWVDIHAPINTVFNFLTRSDGLSRWWASHCESDPRPGGKLHCSWHGDKPVTGDAIFRQFEPPNRVVLEWTHNNGETILCNATDPRGMRWPALNIFELALMDSALTRVHLHDYGINSQEGYHQIRDATATGWLDTMGRLKKVVEEHYRQSLVHFQRKANTAKRKRSEAPPESNDPRD